MDLFDINEPGSVDDIILHIAARKGNIEDLYFLISVGANINATPAGGMVSLALP